MADSQPQRTIGLWGATGIGIGAIVGGGILVIAGEAYVHSGPGAIVAFAINGVIALITALSFAELASAFPQSGGVYTFAKKVLSVRAAFAAGWFLWLAYIVAAALYALGFAYYAVLLLRGAWEGLGGIPPPWLTGRRMILGLGFLATAGYALSFALRPKGGKQWATIGKLALFTVLLAFGLVAVFAQPVATTIESMTPLFPQGVVGLLMATGLTFIALQGFEVIAAVADDIKEPTRTIPLAMFLSLGLALVIYLPLLFVMATVGVPPGSSISELSASQPETVIATGAAQFMGSAGYWLVVLAAILSTLSALRANIMAGSRIALSMARDRTLPSLLGTMSATRSTPTIAIATTALIIVTLLMAVPDLASAAATASLIFLVAFALTHVTAILARRRGAGRSGGFVMPLSPLLPALGFAACAALALFQALAVPSAGVIALIWLGLGVVFYTSVLAERAELRDASAMGFEPDLARLRGHTPLVLLPIANPKHAVSMVALANAMAPPEVGRVLLLSIVVAPDGSDDGLPGFTDTQAVVRQALTQSHRSGHSVEALITTASAPWTEIERIAREHRCESLLLGINDSSLEVSDTHLEHLAHRVDCDVAILRAPDDWRLDDVRRILVPVGGRGGQHVLRARILGSLFRAAPREVTLLRVVPENASDREVNAARREVDSRAAETVPHDHRIEITKSDDAAAAIIQEAEDYDLVILGLQGRGRRAEFGVFATQVAQSSACATLMLNARR